MRIPIKVLLIQMPYNRAPREPLGLAYLAGALQRKGIQVRILCETKTVEINDQLLIEAAATYNIVGFSATTPTFDITSKAASLIKQSYPDVCIALGGYHGTMLHEYIINNHTQFDVVVRGEGEESFIDFLLRYESSQLGIPIPGVSYRFEQRIIIGPERVLIPNLQGLTPALELLPPRSEFPLFYNHISNSYVTKASLVSSRGCHKKCEFCSIIRFYGGNRVRFHSGEEILEDVKRLVSEFGVGAIQFSDDNFLTSIPRAEKIMKGISSMGRDIAIRINASVDQIICAEKLFPAFIEYGLSVVEIGIENFSQPVLDRYQKGIQVSDNIKALSLLNKLNIRTFVDFILFDPWTNLAELEDNLNVFKNDFPWDIPYQKIIYNSLGLFPGTPIFDRAIESKLYTGNPDFFPQPIFRDDDIDEIYAFLQLARKEGDTLIKESKERKQSCAESEKNPSVSDEGSAKQTQIHTFFSKLQDRAALRMLEQVITLKKSYTRTKMPQGDLDQIKKKYLATSSHTSSDRALELEH
jgi:anaerobic magnesium-protoporphyrin IX monomethyl ester cyclase